MVKDIYQSVIDGMTWSYSRLKAFNECQYKWYMKYICEFEERPMFFSSYGSLMHKLIEEFYRGEISKEDMKIKFLFDFQKAVQGDRPSDKIVESYINKGLEYLERFQPLPYRMLEVEKKMFFNVDEYRFVGIIDYLGEKDGELYIVDNKSRDLKPRSNRKKPTIKDQELDEMLVQLYIYSLPIYKEYGKYPKALCFNCFKSGVFIEEPFEKDKYEEAINWAEHTINEIKQTEEFNPSLDYFKCKFLCGLNDDCDYFSMS